MQKVLHLNCILVEMQNEYKHPNLNIRDILISVFARNLLSNKKNTWSSVRTHKPYIKLIFFLR